MAAWTLSEYDRLFRDHPPTEPTAPHGDDLARIARDLDRSTGAIAAQWADARSAVLESTTAASEQLLGYLQRQGWLHRGVMSTGPDPSSIPVSSRTPAMAAPSKAWISGRPAPFATTGEGPWKQAIAAQMPRPSGEHAAGMVLEFTLPDRPVWPAQPDLDNLCEPVFSTVINRLGWFGGSRPNLNWYLATKRPGSELGAQIVVQATAAPDIPAVLRGPVFAAIWPGPLPLSAREVGFADWVRRQETPLPPGPLAVALEFGGSQLNIGEVATGRIKNVIDCLQPILGGPFGNPDDHRIVLLLVVKGTSGLADGAVSVSVGPHP